ncbi:MAG: hypothetical protein ABSA66_15620 [Roseiarcus sp.]|jgi:hypothetical protein
MKALTIWQPWASLIIAHAKRYEFRGWAAPKSVRGERIAIHAGARKVKRDDIAALLLDLRDAPWRTGLDKAIAEPLLQKALLEPDIFPLASVIGTATLGWPVRAVHLAAEFGAPPNDSDRIEHGLWAWPLSSPLPLEPIKPARGAQGFWEWGQADFFNADVV